MEQNKTNYEIELERRNAWQAARLTKLEEELLITKIRLDELEEQLQEALTKLAKKSKAEETKTEVEDKPKTTRKKKTVTK